MVALFAVGVRLFRFYAGDAGVATNCGVPGGSANSCSVHSLLPVHFGDARSLPGVTGASLYRFDAVGYSRTVPDHRIGRGKPHFVGAAIYVTFVLLAFGAFLHFVSFED